MKTLLFACGLLLAGPLTSQAHRAGLPAKAATTTSAPAAARQHREGFDRQHGGGFDRQRTVRPAIQLNLGASRARPYHRGYRGRRHYPHAY